MGNVLSARPLGRPCQMFPINCAISITSGKRRNRCMKLIGMRNLELKKHIRGVRPLERAVEKRDDAEAEVAFPFALLLLNAIKLLALVGAPEIHPPVDPL